MPQTKESQPSGKGFFPWIWAGITQFFKFTGSSEGQSQQSSEAPKAEPANNAVPFTGKKESPKALAETQSGK